ncbi:MULTISPECIES: DUF3679 domain-containing protein [Thermoactinomyces]|jgi:hypothetical protein|uniref:DUF3679 domain-containing protein n=1 Tax=Thermoactinomyces daqus TaxID=1329516 RepID=A0A7W2AHX8_9BACL|nr:MULTISPECIES: DUF3679 domain-containing protein [Thermoactinomyces]MBA4542655.1 DUF3679 domain-containing protein [Thermoactinomyces daqus]MBH8597365.1 DUF3679 domain-containing protein [Thermoactinomyces sp. CICC 10523]MBH8602926.1 DUF3679 domain-containing protein [Thermoactinomyces sp. CICC 10522]MBH8607226.1 DUF3679 domain-containing protein [Thermoactinomyces sp. CICC 10521]
MRVLVQIVCMIGMLVTGIFVGIDRAEQNMQKMQGTMGAPRAIQITPQDGKIEIAVLGQVVETKNPVPKVAAKVRETVTSQQEKNGTNYLAVVGNEVGTGLKNLSRKVMNFIFALAE